MNYLEIPAIIQSVQEFREKATQLLEGQTDYKSLKAYLGGMGVYQQREKGSFMLRVRIPGGILSLKELKDIYEIGSQIEGVRFHFTTREAIQLHDLSLIQTIEVMEALLERNLVTTGGGSNYPRNIACSPLSGVEENEIFDVSPYVLGTAEHIMHTIDTFVLPRKYKIGFSSHAEDASNTTATDLGFMALEEDGKHFFKVFVGGGIGRNPKAGIVYKEKVAPEEILYIVTGLKNLFHDLGDFDNRNTARIRYIVERLGEEQFIATLNDYVNQVKAKETLRLNLPVIEHSKTGKFTTLKDSRLIDQKQEGLYAVYIHPLGGFLSSSEMNSLLTLLENIEGINLRLTMDQSMYVTDLNGEEAEKVIEGTKQMGFGEHTPNIISCVGATTCQIGLSPSQTLMSLIKEQFANETALLETLPQIRISGCGSSCSIHQLAQLGFYGGKKRIDSTVKDAFMLCINGSKGPHGAVLAEEVGTIEMTQIPAFLFEFAKDLQAEEVYFEKALILARYSHYFV